MLAESGDHKDKEDRQWSLFALLSIRIVVFIETPTREAVPQSGKFWENAEGNFFFTLKTQGK